jgi:hypothetical protein
MLILTGGVLLALPLALVAGPPGAAASTGAATGALGSVLDALAGAFRWIGDPTAWAAAILAGTVAAAAAKVWLLRGVRRIGGTRTAVLMLAEPLFGVVLAAIFLGQAIVPVEVAGGALVLLAALLVQRPAAGPGSAAAGPASGAAPGPASGAAAGPGSATPGPGSGAAGSSGGAAGPGSPTAGAGPTAATAGPAEPTGPGAPPLRTR